MGAASAAAAPLEHEAEKMPDLRRRGCFEASALRGSNQKRSRDGMKPRSPLTQELARSRLSTPPSVRTQQRQLSFGPGKRRAAVLRDGVDGLSC